MEDFGNMKISEIFNYNDIDGEYLIDDEGCEVIIYRNWLNSEDAELLFEVARENCTIQHPIKMLGRDLIQPRFNAAFGEAYVGTHKYSGALLNVEEWHPDIEILRNHLPRCKIWV